MPETAKKETLESLFRERFLDPRAMIGALSISGDRIFLTFGDVGILKRVVLQVTDNDFTILTPDLSEPDEGGNAPAVAQDEQNDNGSDQVTGEPSNAPDGAPVGENKDDASLYGSDVLPAVIEIAPGEEVQLGEIVALSHEESGLSVEEWNALPNEEREAKISATLESLRGDDSSEGGDAKVEQIDPDDFKKDELIELAKKEGVEIGSGDTKAEIASAINAKRANKEA